MKPAKRAAINSSAVHVFEVLRTVSNDAKPSGVSDISRRLSLTASSVFRALTTLEATGYVSRHRNLPQFELGTMPYLLNRALLNRFELNAASRPFLGNLAHETGETVSLNVRLGWYSLRVCGIYGSRDIYHRDHLGELALLHESLAGRAILAFLPDDQFDQMLGFLHATDASNPAAESWAQLKDTLAETKRISIVTEEQPMSPGFSAIAMPVRDHTGLAIASITINCPVFPSDKIAKILSIRDDLEHLIAASPKRFISPFAHIPADKIRLQQTRTKLPL
jgi:IclR family acetate operon transcriptional repressor